MTVFEYLLVCASIPVVFILGYIIGKRCAIVRASGEEGGVKEYGQNV